jgi:methionyl aminopeptidase
MSTMLTDISSNIQKIRSIRHGEWDFEYGMKNIYDTGIESYENSKFIHVNPDNVVNVYDSDSNQSNQSKNYLSQKDLEDFRKAAIIHKIARKKALSMLYTGGKLAALVDMVEDTILKLCQQDPKTYFEKGAVSNKVDSGIAFPVGVNINNVVAHDSKITTMIDDRVFYKGDVVKVDIGVHVNGRIIDSAFTHIITNDKGIHDSENIYNTVLEASRDSMFTAIKMSGPDQRLDEMSESISEIIKSYEVDIGGGGTIPIKPVKGIGGHNIKQYQIHGGKLILSDPDYNVQGDARMEEDEIYAIETYASTGYGVMTQNDSMDKCTHYMEPLREVIENNQAISKKDKKFFRKTDLYNWMQSRKGLPFSVSWIDHNKVQKLSKGFSLGIQSGQVTAYPPLRDEDNSVVAQFEHTIHVKNSSVEILSLGDDY